MILSTEYLFGILLSAILLFAVGYTLLAQEAEKAHAPKLRGIEVVDGYAVREPEGLYFTVSVHVQSTSKVCVNRIDIVDTETGTILTLSGGEDGAINLPFCVNPSETYTFGGFKELDTGFAPGGKAMIVIYYSFDKPSTPSAQKVYVLIPVYSTQT